MKRQKLRKELGISDNNFLLISVGELSRRKNHIVVLKALADWKIHNPEETANIRYVIVGKGVLENEYNDFIKEYNLEENVQLLGFRSDIADLLHAADLFVFPSLQEGLPVALMEAMSSGIDVICSRIRGNTDLVKNGLFEPDDIGRLRELIEESMKRETGKNTANLKVMQGFTLGRVQMLMRRVYTNE